MTTEVIIDAMPFDSREVTDPETGDVYYDRIHSAEDFAQWLSTFFGNGIVVAGSQAISSELRVTSSGLVVTVEPGAIVINGRTGWVSTNLSLDISAGGQTGRWDRVVAELNIPNDRQISIKVVQGTNSAPPSLVRTGNVYQLSLAKLRIEAGSASAVVTDERSDLELCGPSNVLVGVQIPEAPTGDEAANIAISDALAQAYGLTNPNKNVEKALDKLKNSISVVVSVNGRTGEVTVQEKITASGLLKGDGNGGVTPNGTVSVEQGGTGVTTLSSGGLLKGNGQGAIGTLSGVGALFALASGSPQFGVLPVALGGTGQNSVDGTPTQNSLKLITSGGVYSALANRISSLNGKIGAATLYPGKIVQQHILRVNQTTPDGDETELTIATGFANIAHALFVIEYNSDDPVVSIDNLSLTDITNFVMFEYFRGTESSKFFGRATGDTRSTAGVTDVKSWGFNSDYRSVIVASKNSMSFGATALLGDTGFQTYIRNASSTNTGNIDFRLWSINDSTGLIKFMLYTGQAMRVNFGLKVLILE